MATWLILSLIILIQVNILNGNNFLKIDCLSITTKDDCNEYFSICLWESNNKVCKFLYQDNDILGAKKIDLVFILDTIIPTDMPYLISSIVSKLYIRYDVSLNREREGLDLRCIIIPYQMELVSCNNLIDVEYINTLLLQLQTSSLLSIPPFDMV